MPYCQPLPDAGGAAIPLPDYDSGWFAIASDATIVKTHNLGGSADDYVVELEYRGGALGHGQSDRWEKNNGVQWQNLTTTQISIYRAKEDTCCQEARVRIWKYA